MRVEQLEYITAVARFGSFRKAAEELHLSQPALSESVRNLERELGIEILDRGHSGTKISEAGRELLPHMLGAIDADLVREPLIGMRPGYVMHRYPSRLFGGDAPSFSFSADGAEMGKLMVAQGLGAAVLPDYSVIGDPLEQSGAITYREIGGDDTAVLLVIQRRRSSSMTQAVGDLHRLFVERAQAHPALT